MITENLEVEGKGTPRLFMLVLITIHNTQPSPLFAVPIRHAVLARYNTGIVGSSSARDTD
jgi:hypothetical protein